MNLSPPPNSETDRKETENRNNVNLNKLALRILSGRRLAFNNKINIINEPMILTFLKNLVKILLACLYVDRFSLLEY